MKSGKMIDMSMTQSPTTQSEDAVYRKVTLRLMPFLFLCYVLAYVDRVNVGFAKLQMQQALGMSDSVYGFGAGVFFIGYFLFEVPANMIMMRIGARRWIGPIMAAWGIVSACTLLVRGSLSFYALRFLLGIVESGFFPGVILYLTYWYTQKHRARMVALFMSAVPVSGIVAGPVSGWILDKMNGAGHLAAWQWLFLVEGIPSIIVGLVTLRFLCDGPSKAAWLSRDERELVLLRLQEEETQKSKASQSMRHLADAFRSLPVWLLGFAYFGITAGNYGITFWLPQVIKDSITRNYSSIGLISAIPWFASAVSMIVFAHHSDKTGERRRHMMMAAVIGTIAFASSAIPGLPGAWCIAALAVAASALMCQVAVFWSLPTAILAGSAAAAGIAWINSLGNLAGQASPYAVGVIRDHTHSMIPALLFLAFMQLMTAILILIVTKRNVPDLCRTFHK
jgi:sugar phosphate permease